MSYILDALKKAEADRDPDTRARLAFEVRERRRNRLITYAVVAALIANAIALLWVFLPDDVLVRAPAEPVAPAQLDERASSVTDAMPPQHSADPAAAEPPAAAAATASASSPPPAATPAPVQPAPRVRTPTPKAAPDEVVIGPGTYANSTGPVALTSLPDSVRRRFPALSFSTHIFADEADLRAVVVNGQRLVEGDRLGELRLERITEDGAVFLFEGRLVEVGVLDGWN